MFKNFIKNRNNPDNESFAVWSIVKTTAWVVLIMLIAAIFAHLGVGA